MTHPAILFRADASHRLGLGHVARIISLIEELAASGRHAAEPVAMFSGDPEITPALTTWLAHRGVTAPLRPWTQSDLLTATTDRRVRAVVLDGTPLADTVAAALTARGVRTVVIDDRGDISLPVDLIVNHNFHAPGLAGGYPRARRLRLGRDYLMLRRAIRALGRGACLARPANALLRVAITFGGSDPVGATARVLRLLPAGRALDVVAIAGPGFTDREALHAAARAASSAGHAVELAEAPDEPGTVFATADAAICAAGGTLGELAFLGCPALAFAIVPDQVDGARAQAQDGLIAGGTTWTADDDDQLRDRLRGFLDDDRRRRQLAQRALATVDGQGAGRIITDILG